MKANFKWIAVLVGLTLSGFSVSAQMSGIYTLKTGVGGQVGDFASLQEAADELMAQGVSGPVTIEIYSGTYVGDMTLGQISGVNANKTVKFVSKFGRHTVQIISDVSQGQDIEVNSSWVMFKELSFAAIMNGADQGGSRYIVAMDGNNSRFVGNKVTCYDCQPGGTGGGLRVDNSNNAIIRDNLFEMGNATGLYVFGGNNVNVSSNEVYATSGIGTSSTTDISIEDNYVSVLQMGIWSYYGSYPNIARNQVVVISEENVAQGIEIFFDDTELDGLNTFRILNNMISILNGSNIWSFGLSIEMNDPNGGPSSLPVEGLIAHNSFAIESDRMFAYGLAVNPHSGSGLMIMNNSFLLDGVGVEAMYLSDYQGTWATGDYNNVFKAAGCVNCTYVDGIVDREDVELFLGMEEHSIEADPLYISYTDLHIQSGSPNIDAASTSQTVALDLDKEIRAGNGIASDIGADELVSRSFQTDGLRTPVSTTASSIYTYPNPSVSHFFVKTKEGEDVHGAWTIYDSLGVIVLAGHFDQDGKVSIESLASGSYVIQCIEAGEAIRFVKY